MSVLPQEQFQAKIQTQKTEKKVNKRNSPDIRN
jgi:hypothetical protein